MSNPETILVNQLLAYLLHFGKAGKVKTMGVVRGGRYTFDKYLFTGHPDIEAFIELPGGKMKHLYIEAKVGKGKQSPAQVAFEDYCNRAGLLYYVIRDLDELIKIVEGIRE